MVFLRSICVEFWMPWIGRLIADTSSYGVRLLEGFRAEWWDTAMPIRHLSNGKLCETSTMLGGGIFNIIAVSSPLVDIWAIFKYPSKEKSKTSKPWRFLTSWDLLFCFADGVFQRFQKMIACACPCSLGEGWAWVICIWSGLLYVGGCLLLLYSVSQGEFRAKSAFWSNRGV